MKIVCYECNKIVSWKKAVLATKYNAQIQTFCEDCVKKWDED